MQQEERERSQPKYRPVLLTLYQLQELDSRLHAIEQQEARVAELETDKESAIGALNELLATQEGQLAEAALLQEQRRGEVEELKEKTKRTRLRVMQISTERELAAINKERDIFEKMLRGKTEEIADLEVKVAEVRERVQERESQRDALLARLEEALQREQETLGRLRASSEELVAVRAELWEKLEGRYQSSYQRLRAAKQTAVARVTREGDSYHCMSCQMKIRDACFQEHLQARTLTKCESCNRYLFFVAYAILREDGHHHCSACDSVVDEPTDAIYEENDEGTDDTAPRCGGCQRLLTRLLFTS